MTKSQSRLMLALVAAVAVGAVAIASLLLASGGESAGREDGVTLRDVVADPARYDGQTVTVSGEWEENQYFAPSEASVALVLGDDAGVRLLVIPDLGADVPALDENTVIQVRGTVRALSASDTAGNYVQPGGILESDGMDVLITASRVSITPPPRITEGPDTTGTTIEAILDDPRAFDGQLVVVGGEPRRTPRGFVLASDGRNVFVSAPTAELEALPQEGEIRIQAKVQRLSGLAADTLERAFTTDPPATEPGEPPVLDRLPVDPGEPYLLLRDVSP